MESAEINRGVSPMTDELVSMIKTEPIDHPLSYETSCKFHQDLKHQPKESFISPMRLSAPNARLEPEDYLNCVIKNEQENGETAQQFGVDEDAEPKIKLEPHYNYEPEVNFECYENETQVDPFAVDPNYIVQGIPFPTVDSECKQEEELHIVDEEEMQNFGETTTSGSYEEQSVFKEEIECEKGVQKHIIWVNDPVSVKDEKCNKGVRGTGQGETSASASPSTEDPQLMARVIDGCKTYCCQLCPYTTTHGTRIKNHLFAHSGHKPFKCNLCSFSSCRAGYLKSHMATHNDDRPYKCSVCSYSYKMPCHLQRHLAGHCNSHSYISVTASSDKVHTASYRTKKVRTRKCTMPACSFRTSNANHLRTHIGEHVEVKPFKCAVCSFCSRRACHLKRHVAKEHATQLTLVQSNSTS